MGFLPINDVLDQDIFTTMPTNPSPIVEKSQGAASVTPNKRGRKQNAEESPTKKSKGETGTALGAIPVSYDQASDLDKAIIRMREVNGDGWAEITKYSEGVMGIGLDRSTMRKRYAKMKANFVVFEAEDVSRLLQAKKQIEDKFELEKWQKIAETIEAMGGGKYPSAAVHKKYKEVSKNEQKRVS